MKKSLKHFINQLQKNGGDFTTGYMALKNLRGGKLPVNNGSCTNGDCSGTNTSVCSNTGDCTKATNSIPANCSNTGGPGCCGS